MKLSLSSNIAFFFILLIKILNSSLCILQKKKNAVHVPVSNYTCARVSLAKPRARFSAPMSDRVTQSDVSRALRFHFASRRCENRTPALKNGVVQLKTILGALSFLDRSRDIAVYVSRGAAYVCTCDSFLSNSASAHIIVSTAIIMQRSRATSRAVSIEFPLVSPPLFRIKSGFSSIRRS